MGRLEEFAEKTADVKDVGLIGMSNAQAASSLYGVMAKEASFAPDGSNPFRMCRTIAKIARELGKPEPGAVTQLKIAAAVVVDDTFDAALNSEVDDSEKMKIAELQYYGREYITELLRGII